MKHIVLLVLVDHAVIAYGQCPNNNSYLSNLTPSGPGNTATTGCIFPGEFVDVNVVAGSTYIFSTCGSLYDTQITIYTSAGFYVAYNDDGCGLQSTITYTAAVNQVLWVLVDLYPCSSSAVCVTLNVTMTGPPPPPPPNDPCSDAIPVSCGNSYSGSTVSASPDATVPAGCGAYTQSSNSVWYSFVGDGNFNSFNLCTSSYDTYVSVYSGSCAGLSCVVYNDDACGLQSLVTFQSTVGVVYYIQVFGFGAGTGNFTMVVGCTTPPPPTPQDCAGAVSICTDTQFGGNSSGEGSISDLNITNQGCLGSGENQSSWYVFSPTTPGTISFTINPTPVVDYDFAIWGPMATPSCPVSGAPLRCSYSGLNVPTGLNTTALDLTEGAVGDAWVNAITVTGAEINQYYVMCVDNFVASSTPFVFDWTLNGVILNCQIMLPIELIAFDGKAEVTGNRLTWSTASEFMNELFIVERSTDGINYETIGEVVGQGYSQQTVDYTFLDREYNALVCYYRLKQMDTNGVFSNTHTVAVQRPYQVHVSPNPAENHFTIRIQAEEDQRVEYQLFDYSGKRIENKSIQMTSGVCTIEQNTSEVSSGFYFVRILNATGELLFSESMIIRH